MPKSNWLENHDLSLSFALLFVLALVGQSIAGHISYNSDQASYGLTPISYKSYLGTGNFLDGVFSNWQAALLQLGCLILIGSKLREKGAAHSLRPHSGNGEAKSRDDESRSWVYRNSLSLAFATLFALAFVSHMFFGAMQQNSNLARIHRPPISTLSYAHSAAFWFSNAQTWEAEFVAIAIYVILSVFLRQKGSPESKPVDSSNKQTGETNH
jgi:hypothetical protein